MKITVEAEKFETAKSIALGVVDRMADRLNKYTFLRASTARTDKGASVEFVFSGPHE